MADVKVTVLDNGPFLVQGPIELMDSNGAVIETKSEKIALCRCGASVNKPFCDGQHSKIGFKAAAQAVPDSAE
jgi:3-phenylpropionate/trans-cinnamate dioxygenase ferredoxin subunit